jgi:hypothetical protein
MRNYIGALLGGTGFSPTTLKSRGGVHPDIGNELAVAQTGSPSMAVTVASGSAWFRGTEAATQGMYGVTNDGSVTLSITAAHASLGRIDIVGIKIEDSFYSGVNNANSIVVVDGTAASSPVAPTQPNNFLLLATVSVAAGVTSIVNANITDSRYYAMGIGGVLQIALEAAKPGGSEIGEGQLLWARNTNRLIAYDGSSYFTVWDTEKPLGLLTGVTATTASSTFTSAAEVVVSTAPSAVFKNGRVYRVTLSGLGVNQTVATVTVANLRIRKGTTNAGTEWINFGNTLVSASSNVGVPAPKLIGNNTGSDITTQCCMTAVTNAGTANINATTTNPRGFWIEDVGTIATWNGVAPVSLIT